MKREILLAVMPLVWAGSAAAQSDDAADGSALFAYAAAPAWSPGFFRSPASGAAPAVTVQPRKSLRNDRTEWAREQWEFGDGRYGLHGAGCGLVAAEAMVRHLKNDKNFSLFANGHDTAAYWRGTGYWDGAMLGSGKEGELIDKTLKAKGSSVRMRVEHDVVAWNDAKGLAALNRRIIALLDQGKPVIVAPTDHYFFVSGYVAGGSSRDGMLFAGNTARVEILYGHGDESHGSTTLQTGEMWLDAMAYTAAAGQGTIDIVYPED